MTIYDRHLFLLVAAILFVIFAAHWAVAEDPVGHATYHHWYNSLQRPDAKGACCNDRDCRPVKYQIGPNGVAMLIGGRWRMMPQSHVMERETPDAGAHWCGIGETSDTPITYCAIIPRGGV